MFSLIIAFLQNNEFLKFYIVYREINGMILKIAEFLEFLPSIISVPICVKLKFESPRILLLVTLSKGDL